jgi:drug/metabolite transporter (DMT)-like permease
VQRRDLVRVVLWMTGALLSFSAMAVSIRALSGTLRILEILAIRNGAGLVILLALSAFNPSLMRAVTARRLTLHVMRNAIHFGGQFLWAMGLTLLPLATVFALEFTMPAYTALLAVMFLGERMTPSRVGVVIFGFLGVLVILRPGLESFRPAALLVLGAAFAYAVALTQTKALTATETTFTIIFWMNVVQLPLAMIGSDPRSYLALGPTNLLPVCAVALSGLASHFCLAQAFRSGDASLVVPLDFMRIPLIALVAWWLYGEALDAYVFAGAGLIVVGVLWNLRAEALPKAGMPGTGIMK